MEAIHAHVTKVSTTETGEGSTKITLEIPRNFFPQAAKWDGARVLVTATNIEAPFGPLESE